MLQRQCVSWSLTKPKYYFRNHVVVPHMDSQIVEQQEFRIANEPRFKVDYIGSFIPKTHARELYMELISSFPKLPNKRLSKTFGDSGLSYTIKFKQNTITRHAQPWTPSLFAIKELLEKHMFDTYHKTILFNICVIQVYPSGAVGINPHRDKEMTPGSYICGISLGETRILDMAKWDTLKCSIPLVNGSLYTLIPDTNNYYSHSIRKDESKGIRISLTFRNYTL